MISSSSYLIGHRVEHEVFEALSLLEGDVSLQGTNIFGLGWLHDPGDRDLSKVPPGPHDSVCCWEQVEVIRN